MAMLKTASQNLSGLRSSNLSRVLGSQNKLSDSDGIFRSLSFRGRVPADDHDLDDDENDENNSDEAKRRTSAAFYDRPRYSPWN